MSITAECPNEIEKTCGGGAPFRRIDETTARLDMLARSWITVQKTRKALDQRELDADLVAGFKEAEDEIAKALKKTLRSHVLWPWLNGNRFPRGAHVALVIGRIGDPRRFPGQPCSRGHVLPAGVYPVGSSCPVTDSATEIEVFHGDGQTFTPPDEKRREIEKAAVCGGVILEARTGTGCRSLWQYAGLAPGQRRRKGQIAAYDSRLKTSLLMPDAGIACQIVRLSTPVYVDVYREAKARLLLRVPDAPAEIDMDGGDAATLAPEDVAEIEIASGGQLSRGHADKIARVITAKAFVGDLLTAWKTLTGPDQ